jgi:hypothetical protein
MKREQWISPGESGQRDVDALLSFLGVASPDSWNAVWHSARVAYRQTRRFRTTAEAISVWVRATELAAAELQLAEFNEGLVRASIKELRRFTTMRADKIVGSVQSLCAAAGIAVVWVPGLRHTGISGCARWLSSNKALIALTLRYKTDDQMWFTFFHELAHILLHRKTHAFVLDNAVVDLSDPVVDPQIQKQEDESNRFAADTLIPPDALGTFIANQDFGNDAIKGFAEDIGVGPGIVVGRLQREGILLPYQGNTFKQKLGFRIVRGE